MNALVLRTLSSKCRKVDEGKIFNRAKGVLQRDSPVTSFDDVSKVLRILFCGKHTNVQAFINHCKWLKQHWKADGTPEEVELLEAFRQAYGVKIPTSTTSSPSLSDPTRLLETEDPDSNPQQYAPLAPQDTTRVSDTLPGPGRPVRAVEPIPTPRIHLTPARPPQNPRGRTDPSEQRRNISPAAASTFVSAGPSEGEHAPSKPLQWDFEGKYNHKFNFNVPLTLRPSSDKVPHATSEPSLPTISSYKAEHPPSRAPSPPAQVPRTSPEARTPLASPDSSKSIDSDNRSWKPGDWDVRDSESSLNPFNFRHPLRPTTIQKISKDDTFIEQKEREVSSTQPALFEAKSHPNTSELEAGDKPMICKAPVIDDYIREAIKKNTIREGHVYILKAPKYFEKNYPGEIRLVKIGIAGNVSQRISELKKNCGLDDLERVTDDEDVAIDLYYKVEELVHSELRNFRRYIKCGKCGAGKSKGLGHREWFAVSEAVALQTVQRWRRFIEQKPCDENGILLDSWSSMMRTHRPKSEEYNDHDGRHHRWNRWLEEGINKSQTPQ
ncbi:MAG: hypothetical protein M1818_004818 [Claussenomyces sp. TS43310]|nr:MAG: hypothetical protein M1818_004818 [Claussenomyces sp. TS43310]